MPAGPRALSGDRLAEAIAILRADAEDLYPKEACDKVQEDMIGVLKKSGKLS